MYGKQYEVGKVCNLAKIFETICFGVQNYTQITANYFKLKHRQIAFVRWLQKIFVCSGQMFGKCRYVQP